MIKSPNEKTQADGLPFPSPFSAFSMACGADPESFPALRTYCISVEPAASLRAKRSNQGNEGRPATPGSPRRFAPRDDDSVRTQHALTPKSRLRAAPAKCESNLPTFLKNNIKSRPAWQEIVDFSYRASRTRGRIRCARNAE
jgi:hypothetical protein